jgi:DNA-binding CsgD family transcriptional regulator
MAVATRWPLVGRRDELDAFATAVQDPRCQAFCIYGPSGVGKSRLGDECIVYAESIGRRVLRATADRADAAVPLAAVAHLLAANALSDWRQGDEPSSVIRARLLDAAIRALAPRADESGAAVLLLDDAQRADTSSLAVIDHLMTHGAAFCVATVNSGEPVPAAVTAWWREERGPRIDLGELDPIGVDTLLHIVLEGALDGAASAELWRASQGNVLILHELVLEALANRSLVHRDGAWRLDGPVGAPPRLGDLVARRLAGLSQSERTVLELLALCQPVAVSQLESAFGIDALEALEQDGLIVARADGRRQSASLTHPLYGEVLRAALPSARAQSILLDQAVALERFGARRRDDPVRIATWRLEATGAADPELLLRAARVARHDRDFATAARLATASLASRPTAIGGLVLGEALHHLGRLEDAEAVLAAATDRTIDDAVLAPLASVRRRNLYVGCGRPDDAEAIGRAAAATVRSPSAHAELIAGEAELLAWSGRPRDALELLDSAPLTGPRLGVLAAVAQSPALASTGRTTAAVELSRQADDAHAALDDPLAVPLAETHRVNELFALVLGGRLVDAAERGRAWFDAALRARLPLEVARLAVHLALGAVSQGRPRTALEWAARATTAIDGSGIEGLRPIAAASRAIAYGLLGDAAASAEAAGEADRLPTGVGALTAALPLARAWASVAAGDLPAARDLLVTAAEEAERAGCVAAAGWLLHDAARIGAEGVAAPRLAALVPATDSELLHARAEHAAALVDDDGHRLATTATRLEALGASLAAAEAATAAAAAWRRRDDQAQVAALAARAEELVGRCEGARTPALAGAGAAAALSERERDVAVLAAEGMRSREIAERLSISARTVDNHLGRIYAKLGVASRVELAAALGPDRREDGRP